MTINTTKHVVGVVAIVTTLAFAALPRRVQACAGCRNPNIPVARLSSFTSTPGEVRATVAISATSVHTVHSAGCVDVNDCHEVPVQPEFLHDQNLYPGELRTMIEVGVSRAFSIEAHLPLRMVRTTIAYSTPDGQPYVPLDAGVHHRNETLVGIGDPWLMGRVGGIFSGWWLAAHAGVSLPLGKTQENPFALGDMGLPHEHIQFGNGTFDPVMSLDVGKTFGKLQMNAYGQAQVSLYQNDHGFRAGNRLLTGVQGGGRAVGSLVVMLGADVTYDGPERWDGQIRQDGFLGRTEVLGGATFIYPFGQTTMTFGARVPVYRHIIAGSEAPGTLSSPLVLTMSVSRILGGR